MTASENIVTRKENLDLYYSTANQHDFNHNENFSFDGILCQVFDFENVDKSLKFSTINNIILMQFCLSGECVYRNEILNNDVTFNNAEYNIFYIPKGNYEATISSKNASFLNIYLEEDFFFRQIPKDHYFFDLQQENNLNALLIENSIITPSLQNVLNEINYCEFDGHLRMLFTKAKVIELIALQLAQQEEQTAGLKPNQIEKMIKVKELIEDNLNKTYSLAYLARAAGTNEQYLKKHFKLLYGETVFGYIVSYKMKKAKEMLLEGKYQISEIAEIVGYKHATHFTTAFKKFFGYLPRLLKTKFLLGSYFSFNLEFELLELFVAI